MLLKGIELSPKTKTKQKQKTKIDVTLVKQYDVGTLFIFILIYLVY
jgi:hypothetical protein